MHQNPVSIPLRCAVFIMAWLIAAPLFAIDQPDCAALVRGSAGVDEGGQEMAAQDREFEVLKCKLERVPMSHEGSRILDRLNRHPVLDKVSPLEAVEFHNAVMRKRMLIRATVQQQQPQQ